MAIAYTAAGDLPPWSGFLNRLLGPAIERELREAEMRHERRLAEIALQQGMKVSTALARVGQELIQHLDTPDLLVRLCQVTADVLECDVSHTIFWQPEEQVFKAIAASGTTDEEWEVARLVTIPRHTIEGWLSRLAHDDVAQDEPILLGLSTPPHNVVQLGIALRRNGALIGLQLATRQRSRRPFDEAERRIGRGIAQFASLILEHARVRHALELSNRLKSDFVATMSHELRTPLNIIVGYNELLLDEEFGPTTPEQIEALSSVGKSARDLLELINATLDFGRLERERVPLIIKPVQLADILEEVDRDVREWQRAKPNVQFTWSIAPGMPELRTDPTKLKVIIRNLVSNSMKFTAAGTVTVSARQRDGGIEICVTDTGIGIAPEIMPIIFEAFRQGDGSTTRKFGGVGLGLYIVRRLTELLGGTVRVESQLGSGSTFYVRLPREAPPASGSSD